MLLGSFSRVVSVAVIVLGLLGGGGALATPVIPAAPTLTISPLHNATVTNTPVVLTGATHDNVPVTNVLFEVNHSGNWSDAVPSNAFTNWSAQVALTAGSNTVSVYAVNTNGQTSRTNSVNVFFLQTDVVSIGKGGLGGGTISPNYSGKALDIGRDYTVTAIAEPGSRFTNWVESTATNSITNTTPRLTFKMQSNLVLVATFVDVEKPTLAITGPAILRTSDAVVTLSGTAHDNVAVETVDYQINGGPTNSAQSANGFATWTATLFPSPGANTIQFWAVDTSGNMSAVRTVRITGAAAGFAPESLNGLTLSADASQVTIIFGTNTYAAVLTNDFADGNFTYTLLGSNTAEVVTTAQGPPEVAGSSNVITLSFTSGGGGTFTSQSSGSGSFFLAGAAPSALETLDEVTLRGTSMNTSPYSFTNVFGDGTLLLTDSEGNSETPDYTYAVFSPLAGVLTETFTNTTNYILLVFAPAGASATNEYFESLNGTNTDAGTFTASAATNKIVGHAPATIAGMTGDVTMVKTSTNGTGTAVTTHDSFTVSFGEASFGQYDSNTNNGSGVGDYTFTRTGSNTAVLYLNYLAPPADVANQNSSSVSLTFANAQTAVFADHNSRGTITLHRPGNLVPISLVGSKLAAHFKAESGVAAFDDGTFVTTGKGFTNSGAYTFAQFGPQVAFVQSSVTNGPSATNDSDAGEANYFTLWFSSPASGSIFDTTTPPGKAASVVTGTFTLQP